MFGEQSHTELRAVSRNAQNLPDKINDQRTQPPERQEHEFCWKKLQIIETVIRAVRSVDASQHENALKELRSVTSFMATEPIIEVEFSDLF